MFCAFVRRPRGGPGPGSQKLLRGLPRPLLGLRINSLWFSASCSLLDNLCIAHAPACSVFRSLDLPSRFVSFAFRVSCFLRPVEPVDARPAADRGLTTRPGTARGPPAPQLLPLELELEQTPPLSALLAFLSELSFSNIKRGAFQLFLNHL